MKNPKVQRTARSFGLVGAFVVLLFALITSAAWPGLSLGRGNPQLSGEHQSHYLKLSDTKRGPFADDSYFTGSYEVTPASQTLQLGAGSQVEVKNAHTQIGVTQDFATQSRPDGSLGLAPKLDSSPAGLYHVNLKNAGGQITKQQTVAWGVLAFNPNYAIYPVNSVAQLAMAVLDDRGKMICDAALTLDITDPNGQKTTLSVGNGGILINDDCHVYGATNDPDYLASYQTKSAGIYHVTLTATVGKGVRTLHDSFQVADNQPFYLERSGATRIYPPVDYDYSLILHINKTGTYTVTEAVPASFELKNQASSINSTIQNIRTDGDKKVLTWTVAAGKGEVAKLGFTFHAPNISPYLFVFDPVTVTPDNGTNWTEPRSWLIASDNACQSAGTGNWNTSGTWTGCGSTVPQTGDTVEIMNTHTVTMDTSPTIVSINIDSGGVLIHNSTAKTLTLNGTSGTLFTLGGTFTPSTYLSVATSGAGNATLNSATTTFYNLTLAPGTGNTTTLGGIITTNNLTISSGTLDVKSGSNYAVNINGSYSNSGVFTAQAGTVTFGATSGSKTLAGNMTGTSAFYNLTFNGSGGGWGFSNDVTLNAGGTFTVTLGTVTTNSHTVVVGTNTGGGNLTLANTSGVNLVPGTSSITVGGNWSDAGNKFIYTTASNVYLIGNGTVYHGIFANVTMGYSGYTTTFDATSEVVYRGVITFNGGTVTGGGNAIYIKPNVSSKPVVFASPTTLNGTLNIVYQVSADSITTTVAGDNYGTWNVKLAPNNNNDAFSLDADITIASNRYLVIEGANGTTGTTFTTNDHTITAGILELGESTSTGAESTSLGASVVNLAVYLMVGNNGGTGHSLDMGSAQIGVVSSVLFVQGTGTTTVTPGTSTLTMKPAASNTPHYASNAQHLNNFIINGASNGNVQLDAAAFVDGDLTMTSGNLIGTQNMTVLGNVNGTAGVINLTGGTFEQRVAANRNFGTTSGSTAWTFFALTFSNSDAAAGHTITTQTGGTGTITVTSILSVGKAGDTYATTLDAGNRTWTLSLGGASPNPFQLLASPAGVLTGNSSTFNFTNSPSSGNTTVQGATYFNLTVNASGKIFVLGGATTVGGTLTITAGTLDVSGSNYALSIGGSYSNSGTFTAESGTVTFTSTTGGKTLAGTLSGTSSFYNLTFNGSGGDWTLGAATTVTNNLAISAGTLIDGAKQITGNGTGTFTMAAGTFLTLGGASATTFPASFTAGHTTLDAASTVTYNAVVTQTISSTPTYGNVTLTAASGTPTKSLDGATTLAGTLTINTSNTLDVTGSNFALNIGGSYANSGTFTAQAGTVTFTATTTGKTLSGTLNGTSAFYNLTFNGSGGEWTPGAAVTVTNDLTVTAGSLLGTQDISVGGGDVTGNGIINLSGGTFTLLGAGNFGGTTAWIFSSLTIGSASVTTTTTATGAGGITVTTVMGLSGGIGHTATLNAGSKTWTLSGTTGSPFGICTLTANVFNADTSTFIFTGANSGGDTIIPPHTYNNLQVNNGAETYDLCGPSGTVVSGDFTITAGTVTAAASGANLSIGGSYSNSGTFTASTKTVTFTSTTGGKTLSGNMTGTSAFYDLTFNGASGAWSFGANNADITDTLTITNGTVTAPSTNLNIAKNFSNAGTFTNNSGTVTLNGSTQQTISGTLTTTSAFYNLTITNASGASASDCELTGFTPSVIFSNDTTATNNYVITTADVRVQYHTGSTYTFNNINWNGQATGTRIFFRNSAASGTWLLNVSGTQTAVSYVNVCRSDASGGNQIASGNGTNVNCGSNTNWLFDTAPNNPSALAQVRVTAGTPITAGGWTNETQVKFTASADDTDNPDTLYLCVEKRPLGTSFSNTEDACGTGVLYSGTPVTVEVTIASQTDATSYHWQARVKDTAGYYSGWVAYGGGVTLDYGIDTTAPTGGNVYDGVSAGVDADYNDGSLTALSGNWANFNFDVSGINKYEYSFGTTAGGTDLVNWTSVGTSTNVTATSLNLHTGLPYYLNVRATDNASNVSSVASSNGQLVLPQISFSLSGNTITFSNLNASNDRTDTKTTTLTTSTNAYNGYVITQYTDGLLRNGAISIPMFSAGSYASPAAWANGICSGASCGLGYTSNDPTIQGSNKFGSGNLFAPYSQTASGDIVADHTDAITGLTGAVTNEQFIITHKVAVDGLQPALIYNAMVYYVVTGTF